MIYKKELELLNKNGYSDLFDLKDEHYIRLERESNEFCKKTCTWKSSHGRDPNQRSDNTEEKGLATWLQSRRKALNGTGGKDSCIFYKSDQEIACSCGYPDLFKQRSFEEVSNKMCSIVCEWIRLQGRYPSHGSKNKEEKDYGSWVKQRRNAYKGGVGVEFYDSDQKIAEFFGYKNLFKNRDFEKESNELCKKICEWKKEHQGNDPNRISENTVEKSLGNRLAGRRKAFSDKGGIFYSSDQKIAESFGYPNLFKPRDLEKESNDICYKVCEWKKRHNDKDPVWGDKKIEEHFLGYWLGSRRNGQNYYESDKKIAESYEYPDIFNKKNPEKESNVICKKVCEWKNTHAGEDPKQRTKNSMEKKLYTWLHTRRQVLSGIKKAGIFYESDQKIAKSYGYFDLFKSGRSNA